MSTDLPVFATWQCPRCGRTETVKSPTYYIPSLYCRHDDEVYVMVPLTPFAKVLSDERNKV